MFTHSPRIVTDGLVLYLDAGNTKSYPGSGTTWKDLSGNGNDGTLVNGVGYESGNNGVLVCDGTDEQVVIPKTPSIDFDETTSFTLSVVCKLLSFENRKTSIFLSGNNRNSYGISRVDNDIWVATRGSNTFGERSSIISTNNALNSWIEYTMVYDSSNTEFFGFINGIFSNGRSISDFSIGNSSGYTIFASNAWGGSTTPGDTQNGLISHAKIYNRALTSQEILQNYNATKGRYGL